MLTPNWRPRTGSQKNGIFELGRVDACATLCCCDIVALDVCAGSGRTSGAFPAQPNAVTQEFAQVSSRNHDHACHAWPLLSVFVLPHWVAELS